MLSAYGIRDIIVCDKAGAIYTGRKNDMNPYKVALRKEPIREDQRQPVRGDEGAKVFLGLCPNIITPDDIRKMAKSRSSSPCQP
jgi:malate dehydrogenase (oxaloacetate-decarboxylating)